MAHDKGGDLSTIEGLGNTLRKIRDFLCISKRNLKETQCFFCKIHKGTAYFIR